MYICFKVMLLIINQGKTKVESSQNKVSTKRILLLIMLFCLSGMLSMSWAQVDSLYWNMANQEMRLGNYKKACELYLKMDSLMENKYDEINSHQVEDLRRTYSIDEVKLQSDISQNNLLRLGWVVGGVFVILCVGYYSYIKSQNKRLNQSREALARAIATAKESVRNKSLFLSNMSHEIKTPLNALSGFSEVLITPGIDEATRQQCCEVIQLNSELLLKLLNDVIDISCLDVSKMKFQLRPCEVVALCENVVKTLSAIKQTDAEIIFKTDLASLEIDTDMDRLQQMLINLLVNATKFTKQGTIVLELTAGEESKACFSVTDTGCGIPLEKQANLFKRFEKLNEQSQGTGLGLSICMLIIKRLGGNIWIDSDYTQGARFVFNHPIKQGEKS